jgi:hypothetical protein
VRGRNRQRLRADLDATRGLDDGQIAKARRAKDL